MAIAQAPDGSDRTRKRSLRSSQGERTVFLKPLLDKDLDEK
ncbi:hypothetical protein [Nostoc sp. ChiQUE01b]|nr:hypothetical protein [Nostoc sp. ChiQUE01b]MDZ8259046.1 hypothetical protein [Nostoc sp. ChiQUE01b]